MDSFSNKLVIIDQTKLQRRYGYRIIKRCLDLVLSICGLMMLLPLFMIVALAIKLDDPQGRILYTQIRIGRHRQPFKIYKFRSMVTDAEQLLAALHQHNEIEGAMFKMKTDPRVTRTGRFIRKYSIDELPQLWNVVIGDMSLVGPRPPIATEVVAYTEYDQQRLCVKPGCTGLWQATVRNSVGFHEMVYLDLIYIQKSSISYDLWILMKTVKMVVKPTGAY
ncbi:sugar transferase [Lactiplantibacillus sp. DA1]|uniref:sugar transferase n=1 Tax=Lactiplantibacillus sp. DA1 TaxID=3079857 RepID=UPI00292A62B1|nr:sugar transferase [Lactiplantibacillus sp. DA1]MDV0430143.1 sugar transferase [Lactiplantibacillus sp. DA1]